MNRAEDADTPTRGAASARTFVVDRREGDIVILIDDVDERTVDVDRRLLPGTCRAEGAVLHVPLDGGGHPLWSDARRDRAEERRRRAELSARLERLRTSDPGGDIVL